MISYSKNLVLIGLALSMCLFSGCISSLAFLSMELEYLNHTNNTIFYNGSIDITGDYLINGVALNGSSFEYPINSTFVYNVDYELISISENYSDYTFEGFFSYYNGTITNATLINSKTGSKELEFVYNEEGYLVEVIYT